MISKTRSASAPIERSQFEDFLFAPIGHEQNGMLLSVLSALARLDIDPWVEAASLAKMSTGAATERMRLLIAALPEETSAHLDADAIAPRLIALLPPREVLSKPIPTSRPKPTSGPRPTKIAPGAPGLAVNYRVVVFLIVMALLLVPQLLLRSVRPPAQADSAQASAPSTISSSNSPQ
jgi:hypothetical protein